MSFLPAQAPAGEFAQRQSVDPEVLRPSRTKAIALAENFKESALSMLDALKSRTPRPEAGRVF